MKIKRYGKNTRQLKKLLANGARIIGENNSDWTEVFKVLVGGYEFMFEIVKEGLEITDRLGDTYILKSEETFEIV